MEFDRNKLYTLNDVAEIERKVTRETINKCWKDGLIVGFVFSPCGELCPSYNPDKCNYRYEG